MKNKEHLEKIIKSSVQTVLSEANLRLQTMPVAQTAKKVIKEALVVVPKSYVLKTEVLSPTTKEVHEKVYKYFVDVFNKVSSKLDTINKSEILNAENFDYRNLKNEEQNCLNGIKLHELYFSNISAVNSEIRLDALPYMRLARDFGSFENWQFDFRACALSSLEGWVMCYYDPYKERYLNVMVKGNGTNLPVAGIPVLVFDTHHHAWFRDFPEEKITHMNKMMQEINWVVVEARMLLAEKSNLNLLYQIVPAIGQEQEKINVMPVNQAPVQPTGPSSSVTAPPLNAGIPVKS